MKDYCRAVEGLTLAMLSENSRLYVFFRLLYFNPKLMQIEKQENILQHNESVETMSW